jgi:quercetin dioxygenase-like cupin family protein
MSDVEMFMFGPLLTKQKISGDQISRINKLCEKNPKLLYKRHLAGHIDDEYKIDTIGLENIISEQIEQYYLQFDRFAGGKKRGSIISAWVNYMKPGDFNPPHHHDDDLSGVIYLQVPSEIHLEAVRGGYNSRGPGSIHFNVGPPMKHFNYSYDLMPETGDIFIFPAGLFHSVAPYKSKVERISVAFNIRFDN